MGNCKSTRCGREGEVIEPIKRSASWSEGQQTNRKATKFGEPTIEDRPINEQITIYNENEINDRIARLETLKVERRAWIKDEYHRIFGDGQDDNFPKRSSTSIPLMRPPASSTGFTSSYNVPSATNFTEREKIVQERENIIIEERVFEDPVRSVAPVTGNTKPDKKQSTIADNLFGTVSMSAGKGPFRATVFSNPQTLSKIGSVVDNSLHGVKKEWNSLNSGIPNDNYQSKQSGPDSFKSGW